MNKETELLTPAQTLYNQGRQIGRQLEERLQRTIQRFYRDAIPFAYTVKEQRPWISAEFSKLADAADPNISLLNFLKTAFAGGGDVSEKTASQQANIVSMVVIDNLQYQDIEEIPFRYLLKMSYAVRQITKRDRLKLLSQVKTCQNIKQFEALVDSLKRKYAVEPRSLKTIEGSQSAIKSIETYSQVTQAMGDKRTEGEKLGDLTTAFMATEPDIALSSWSGRVIAGYCKFMRRKYPSIKGYSDTQILGDAIYIMWQGLQFDFDDEAAIEFSEIEKASPLSV